MYHCLKTKRYNNGSQKTFSLVEETDIKQTYKISETE